MARFESFIVFAEMRTGSNFLQENLNAYPDIDCQGELFNPHFIGAPNKETVAGITQADRDADPIKLLTAVRQNAPALTGFRCFHDHDARAIEHCLADPTCAKVVLTRNPVESYVSWKIAASTGQWRLTNATHHRTAKIIFDQEEFEDFLHRLQVFQIQILNTLQKTGQTAFYIAYEDVQDIEVMNGLAKFLGSKHQRDALDTRLKKQNPAPMSDKVENFEEMERALIALDQFNLSRTPNFEPRRGPVVPGYIGAVKVPLLYLPMRSGGEDRVVSWLAALDGGDETALLRNFSQKTLRQWKRQNKGHRTFTMVRHPVSRAYEAYCRYILATGPEAYLEIRKTLRQVYNVPLPKPKDTFDADQTRESFIAFLTFVKANLNGQTAIRTDVSWASQSAVLDGYADVGIPDLVLREAEAEAGLAFLAQCVGAQSPVFPDAKSAAVIPLAKVYSAEVEKAARDAYQRDYLNFGFKAWDKA